MYGLYDEYWYYDKREEEFTSPLYILLILLNMNLHAGGFPVVICC